MKNSLLTLLVVMAAAALAVPAHADEAKTTIAFSDPSKPGTLRIRVWHGQVSVHGSDDPQVTVQSEGTVAPPPREDGLRVLSASASYSLSERHNVITLEYGADGWSNSPADFKITVPKQTSIVVANSVRGDFSCSGVTGDIDVRTMDGEVSLQDVTGRVIAETMNGDIKVKVKALGALRPLSFMSMNGKITIEVPGDAKAAVRFRTHRGTILTDFDEKTLVTHIEMRRRTARVSSEVAPVAAVPAAAPAAPDTPAAAAPAQGRDSDDDAPTADSDSDSDWRSEVRTSVHDATKQAVEAVHEALEAAQEGIAEAKVEINSGTPPAPPLPPMTGGKVVTGNLNGGGPSIEAATLNGDILLKKAQ